METENKKQTVLRLIGDIGTNPDAEKELIKICAPVIVYHYKIASDFEVLSEMGWDSYYTPYDCNIESYCGMTGTSIGFSAKCEGFEKISYPRMSLDWLDDDSEESYKQVCKAKKATLIDKQIEEYKKKITSLEKKREEILNK